jgi:DNA-binding CsgD family transcriptional regulator
MNNIGRAISAAGLYSGDNHMDDKQVLRYLDTDFDALLHARHWEELTALAQTMLSRLGVDSFLKKMRIVDGGGKAHVHTLSSLSPLLTEQVSVAADADADPIARHVARQGIPLAWDIDPLCRDDSGMAYAALKESGIRAGLSVAARSEQSFSRIDFYSVSVGRFGHQAVRNELLLFCCYLNEAVRTLWLRQHPQTSRPVLTSREQQCLRWSASGKTSNEIGSILGISPNTVYFHLKKAASKFEVYGTRHAITRAIEMGLI